MKKFVCNHLFSFCLDYYVLQSFVLESYFYILVNSKKKYKRGLFFLKYYYKKIFVQSWILILSSKTKDFFLWIGICTFYFLHSHLSNLKKSNNNTLHERYELRIEGNMLLWANKILGMMALILLIVDTCVYATGKLKHIGNITVVLFGITLGLAILVLLSSLLGYFAAKTKLSSLVLFYILALVSTIQVEIGIIGSIVLMYFDPSFLESAWNNFSVEEQRQVEQKLNCCGFDGESSSGTINGTLTTTTLLPCTGCKQAMKNNLRGLYSANGAIIGCLLVYEIALFARIIRLYCHKKTAENKDDLLV
ncbi:tetraspanin-31 A [Reticulomyxa filosa]|uniref:Tetraspanin-31 A n=1 Tax=Reticulomyxa filosa TaxID=46433 RepID=X6LVX5_RETFI|nr:tetraspanin-31 A [Reticulomyxa filosa]|eukprot:ETO05774.1 tetraspanin-31 A [Reticulomyxa filosa]